MRPDELCSVLRLNRRTIDDSSSRRSYYNNLAIINEYNLAILKP